MNFRISLRRLLPLFALALLSCESSKPPKPRDYSNYSFSPFDQAALAGTPEALEAFIKEYPGDPLVTVARQKIDKLKSDAIPIERREQFQRSAYDFSLEKLNAFLIYLRNDIQDRGPTPIDQELSTLATRGIDWLAKRADNRLPYQTILSTEVHARNVLFCEEGRKCLVVGESEFDLRDMSAVYLANFTVVVFKSLMDPVLKAELFGVETNRAYLIRAKTDLRIAAGELNSQLEYVLINDIARGASVDAVISKVRRK